MRLRPGSATSRIPPYCLGLHDISCGLFFVAAITYEPRVPFNAKGVSLVVVVLVAQLLFCVGVESGRNYCIYQGSDMRCSMFRTIFVHAYELLQVRTEEQLVEVNTTTTGAENDSLMDQNFYGGSKGASIKDYNISSFVDGIKALQACFLRRSCAVVLSTTPTPASPYPHHQAVVPYYGYAPTTYVAATDVIYNHLDTVAEFQLDEETVLRLNGGGVAYKPATSGVWRCS
ncbi:hypothetical protein Tco_0103680 [Tanacetum coccineum]